MKKKVIILMIIAVASKVIAFLKDIILANFYGASFITDAFFISQTIPSILFGMIVAAIVTSYIPLYNQAESEEGNQGAKKFTNNLISVVLIIATIVITISLIFTKQITLFFASGFEGEVLSLAIIFTRISLVSIYFIAIFEILKAFLQIKGSFSIPALTLIPFNIIVITAIILSTSINISILAFGSVLAIMTQAVILIFYSNKMGFSYNLTLNLKDKYLKKMLILSMPVMIGTSASQLNIIIDRTLASRITEGGISALSYAVKIDGIINGIIVLSIITVLFPSLSKMATENNMVGLKKSLAGAINGVALFVVPATVGCMIFSKQIIELMYGRGEFVDDAIYLTSNALFFYSIGMIGYGIRNILTKTFYSLQDTKTPLINSTIAIILNIILNFILSKYIGLGGLALATSLSSIIAMVLLFIGLRKKIGSFGIKNIITTFIKILFASIIMGVLTKLAFLYLILHVNQNFSLLIVVGMGVIVYFIMIILFKIEDVDNLIVTIKTKYFTKFLN